MSLAFLGRFFRRQSSLPWKLVAHRYRRWFKAELAGNLHNKRRGDEATYKLHLAGRCAFCGLEFTHGERITWMPDHQRGYCDSCRDEIDAAERREREQEAAMDGYALRGVSRKDFYR